MRGIGIRWKVLLGFGGLLLILLAVSLLADRILVGYSEATRHVLDEDLSTVVASERIRDAVEQLDLALQSMAAGAKLSDQEIAAAGARIGQAETALTSQKALVTFPAERELTHKLELLWAPYQRDARRMLDGRVTGPEARSLYDQSLAPLARDIVSTAGAVFEANVASIGETHRQARSAARTARWTMHAMTAAGVLAAAVFALLIGHMILGPIRLLTDSVHEVERGNLEAAVPVRSSDELGKLARAFNDMAAQLRVYRQVDHEKLIRSQHTTQLAIDSLHDGVVLLNPHGRIELSNETAKRVFQLEPGTDVSDLRDTRLVDLGKSLLSSGSVASGGGFERSVRVDDEGQERYFLPKAIPILDEGRRPVGWTLVLGDVTEYRRLDEMKNGLLSLVSHELKTPLTSMRMILPLVLEGKTGPLSNKQRDLLSAAREDAEKLHRIVENLLDMGRIASGRVPMELRPVAPSELLAASLESWRSSFEEHGVGLVVEPASAGQPGSAGGAGAAGAPGPDLAVLGDRARLGHVFSNLLGNALRYTPRGGTVRVGYRELGQSDADEIEFWVSDDGEGIPQQYLPRVFDKFFRVPGQKADGGTGLGLAIVKGIVEGHNGRVRAESTPGAGSTFRFTLRKAGAAEFARAQETPGNESRHTRAPRARPTGTDLCTGRTEFLATGDGPRESMEIITGSAQAGGEAHDVAGQPEPSAANPGG